MMMSLSSLTDHLVGWRRLLSDFPLLSSSSPGTELSSRAIFQPIYFLMWSNLGHLPLGRLYVVINDGYLAQVPGGALAHLHNTDRYSTALQDQPGQDRSAADWREANRCEQCHCATAKHHAVFDCCQVVAAFSNHLQIKLCRVIRTHGTVAVSNQSHLMCRR